MNIYRRTHYDDRPEFTEDTEVSDAMYSSVHNTSKVCKEAIDEELKGANAMKRQNLLRGIREITEYTDGDPNARESYEREGHGALLHDAYATFNRAIEDDGTVRDDKQRRLAKNMMANASKLSESMSHKTKNRGYAHRDEFKQNLEQLAKEEDTIAKKMEVKDDGKKLPEKDVQDVREHGLHYYEGRNKDGSMREIFPTDAGFHRRLYEGAEGVGAGGERTRYTRLSPSIIDGVSF